MEIASYFNESTSNRNRKSLLSFHRAFIIYLIVSFFLFFEMAVQISPSVMSSQLMSDLKIGTFGFGVMAGFYFYTYTAMQIFSGFLLDKYGPRLVITLSIFTCSLGAFIFSFSEDVYFGSLARLFMGAGSAFAFVSVLVVAADLFHAKYFAIFAGLTQMLAALGSMTGQMPVGILVSDIGWRKTMVVLSGIGFLLALVVWKWVNYKKVKSIPQFVISSTTLKGALHTIVTQSQTWYVAIYSCLLWAPMSGFASLWGVPFLETVNHLSKTESAFLCSLMWLGLAIISPILGMISTAAKNRVYPLILSAALGVIAFGLLLTFSFSKEIVGLLLFLAGAACSGQALSFAVVNENNTSAVKATAIAFNNMAIVISGAIFQPVIGKLISMNEATMSLENSYKYAIGILFFAYLTALFVAIFFIKENREKTEKIGPGMRKHR